MLRCSFCSKSEHEIEKLVAGPHVYICNDCVLIAARMMMEKQGLLRRVWQGVREFFAARSCAAAPLS
jgi:ATP-dependent protease Clp ATPase subunit